MPSFSRERPLRVAHLIYGWTLGGLEQLVVELCVLGRAQGVESMIISFGPDGPMRHAAADKGIATHWIEGAGLEPHTLLAIRRAVARFDAEVLHAHDLGPWLNAVAVRASRPATQVVATFHQMEIPEGAKRHAATLAAAATGALVACGTEVRERLELWAPRFARKLTIGNGVRLGATGDRAKARERLGIPSEAITVGYLGRMAEVKGPDLLLAAFLAAFANRPEVHLAMVGEGPMLESLRASANGQPNVHLPGPIVDAQALLGAFDVYAQTSLSEGRSLAMLEAMAAGLPTLAHDLAGVREIHSDKTALLVPAGDRGALRAGLERLVADPGLREALGAAARREVRRYGIDVTLDAYLDLYRALARGAALPIEAGA